MTKIINFLEKMGQATSFEQDRSEFCHELEADVPAEALHALRTGNVDELNLLLQVRTQVICGLHPAEDPDKDDEEQPEDTEDEQEKRALLAWADDRFRHAG
ncbi:hypothetical protein [Alkalimonas mucilaginosa]|uniref:Nif11 domain-containing protein n=1 Tax=Alkalimonas mucilaginosa TaxID=3057676 RepID=A0ABU7JDJ7_9GAMM|nr:hypothetical protein [Alkalimonas sp. MEB004]MEE2023777.1 hypothetical protein [Alkalimonas sp. MEB004]